METATETTEASKKHLKRPSPCPRPAESLEALILPPAKKPSPAGREVKQSFPSKVQEDPHVKVIIERCRETDLIRRLKSANRFQHELSLATSPPPYAPTSAAATLLGFEQFIKSSKEISRGIIEIFKGHALIFTYTLSLPFKGINPPAFLRTLKKIIPSVALVGRAAFKIAKGVHLLAQAFTKTSLETLGLAPFKRAIWRSQLSKEQDKKGEILDGVTTLAINTALAYQLSLCDLLQCLPTEDAITRSMILGNTFNLAISTMSALMSKAAMPLLSYAVLIGWLTRRGREKKDALTNMERLEPLIQEAFSNSLTSDKKNFLIDLGRSTAERNLQEAKTIFDRVIRGEEKGAVTPEEIEYHCGTQYLEQERKALKAIEELTRDFASAVAGQVFGKVKDKSSPLSQNAVRSLRGAASSLCWTEKKLRKWVMDLAISRAKAHFGRSYWVTIDHNLRHAKERLKAPPGSDRAALTDALYGHSISFADLMMRGELSSPS